ncbi:hypothetical protein D3C77_633740 [compost metagenome]
MANLEIVRFGDLVASRQLADFAIGDPGNIEQGITAFDGIGAAAIAASGQAIVVAVIGVGLLSGATAQQRKTDYAHGNQPPYSECASHTQISSLNVVALSSYAARWYLCGSIVIFV